MPIDPITLASARALSFPLKDIYELGKEKFSKQIAKWKSAKAIEDLEKKIKNYEKVKTIWQRDKEVSLSSFYYPSKIIFSPDITKKVTSLKELPRQRNLVLEGTVGQGKSVFLRFLCTQELKAGEDGRIPIFIELRKLTPGSTIKEMVEKNLDYLGFDLSQELFELYANSGRLVLLLDAFDGLDEGEIRQVINDLEYWSEKFPLMQIIITSRPNSEIQKSAHFQVLRLSPLKHEDHEPFLTKIGIKGQNLKSLLEAIQSSPSDIRAFLTTPLLLTLLVLVYKAESTIPSELPSFFEVLFVTVLSKHDGTKPGYTRPHKTGLNEKKLEQLFEAFCFSVMQKSYGVSLDENQLFTALNDATKIINIPCDEKNFKHDLVKVACLILEDGFKYAFAHKSLLEYFTAAFIKHRTQKQSEKIYEAILNLPRRATWRSILQYLSLIDRYRFFTNFGCKEITTMREHLGILSDTPNSGALHKAINIIFEKSTIGFSKNSEDDIWRTTSIGGFSLPFFYGDHFLALPLAAKIFDIKPSELVKISHLEDRLKKNPDRSHIEVDWKDINQKNFMNSLEEVLKQQLVKISEFHRKELDYIRREDELADALSTLQIAD